MPIYEYKCENCGEVFEVRQNYSDEPVTVHAKCGGRVEKLISAPSFNFKGSGWYVNDYGKGNNGAKKPDTEGKSTADSGKGASDSTTKSDSATPAKTSETKSSDSGSSSSSTTSTSKTSKTE